jgi:ketosteroid isomerase-like protein
MFLNNIEITPGISYFQYMKKILLPVALAIVLFACQQTNSKVDPTAASKEIGNTLDSFNRAAARADFNAYFSYYTEDGIFCGTDATERWDKKQFMEWSKPYFDKGKAWNFTAIDRHIYIDPAGELAWFDELLSTQMKICRGSGVLVMQNNEWKLKQYVLSTTVPNSLVDTVTIMKTAEEDSLMRVITTK